MDDNQKWLEAAAAIEQDICYLRAAMATGKRNGIPSLEKEISQLNLVLGVYRQNANSGVAFPNPDDLYCINAFPRETHKASTALRRSFKLATV